MRTYVNSVLAGLEDLRDSWGALMGLGIVIMLFGVIAIFASRIATFTAVLTFGILMLAAGIVHIVHAIRARDWNHGFFLSLAVGVIYLVTGLLLVAHPGLGALTLTILMASFFVAMGIFRIIAALSASFPSRGWVLLDGIVSLILGAIIWRQLPTAALWVIGLFVGIEMLFAGWSLVSLAMYVRDLPAAGEKDIRLAA